MAGMQYTMKLNYDQAHEVRKALVDRVAQCKLTAVAKHSTDAERLEAGRSVLTLEALLRVEYGDYEESETRPADGFQG